MASSVQPSVSGIGVLGMVFGFIVFGLGVLTGGNLIVCGLGLLFIGLGYSARPKRLCPACKLAIPKEATVCGHCRSALTA